MGADDHDEDPVEPNTCPAELLGQLNAEAIADGLIVSTGATLDGLIAVDMHGPLASFLTLGTTLEAALVVSFERYRAIARRRFAASN